MKRQKIIAGKRNFKAFSVMKDERERGNCLQFSLDMLKYHSVCQRMVILVWTPRVKVGGEILISN
ncbi:hypothetical protein [Enterococcus songbeiensis]